MATGKHLSQVMQRLQAAGDVQVDIMQTAVDEAFILAVQEMKDMLTDPALKPETRVAAAGTIVAGGNYLVRRRALNSTKQVKVVIGEDMRIKEAEVTLHTEADLRQGDEPND